MEGEGRNVIGIQTGIMIKKWRGSMLCGCDRSTLYLYTLMQSVTITTYVCKFVNQSVTVTTYVCKFVNGGVTDMYLTATLM